jgi:hypothetical protein
MEKRRTPTTSRRGRWREGERGDKRNQYVNKEMRRGKRRRHHTEEESNRTARTVKEARSPHAQAIESRSGDKATRAQERQRTEVNGVGHLGRLTHNTPTRVNRRSINRWQLTPPQVTTISATHLLSLTHACPHSRPSTHAYTQIRSYARSGAHILAGSLSQAETRTRTDTHARTYLFEVVETEAGGILHHVGVGVVVERVQSGVAPLRIRE